MLGQGGCLGVLEEILGRAVRDQCGPDGIFEDRRVGRGAQRVEQRLRMGFLAVLRQMPHDPLAHFRERLNPRGIHVIHPDQVPSFRALQRPARLPFLQLEGRLHDLGRGLQSIHDRHSEIHNHNVRREPLNALNGLDSVAGLAAYLPTRLLLQ